MKEELKILIVSGYHQKETFAVGVGESLIEKIRDPRIRVVRYSGKPDKVSCYNLRRFIEKFGSMVLSIVLHNDEHFERKLGDEHGTVAIIIYYAKSGQEKKEVLKPLFDFVSRYNKRNTCVIFDIRLTYNAKNSLVEIEFNPNMGLKKAEDLVLDFSRCLLNLHLNK